MVVIKVIKDLRVSTLVGVIVLMQLIIRVVCSDDEDRLITDLFRSYNSLIRPVPSVNATPLIVSFSLAMILLINVDEKNQIMQTNVWLTLKWTDYQLTWDPESYGKIKTIRVPPDKVWLPDVVLFNNADGRYEVSFYSNVVIESSGSMLWVPPAIYKSSCTIDVEYFPFDEQQCSMIFGSWTFNKDEVQIDFLDGKDQVELNDYSPSGIWDIMDVPAELVLEKAQIKFCIRIRRKTLFYTVILIIPTVLMAFLSMMVFYLPADASEKITLAISILLALVVFLLLVSKILPPTSSTIPLMAKYLLLTFVLNIITILVTVIIINIYFRGPTTHRMAPWVRHVFLDILPKFLMMQRPKRPSAANANASWKASGGSARRKRRRALSIAAGVAGAAATNTTTTNATGRRPTSGVGGEEDGGGTTDEEEATEQRVSRPPSVNREPRVFYPPTPVTPGKFIEMTRVHHPNCSAAAARRSQQMTPQSSQELVETHIGARGSPNHRRSAGVVVPPPPPPRMDELDMASQLLSPEAYRAIEAIEYITEHLRQDDEHKKVRDDWKYIAMVIDRLLLYIFFGVTAGGTLGILLSAPNVFEYVDQDTVIAAIKAKATSG